MRKTKTPALLSAILITALAGCSASEKETPPGPTFDGKEYYMQPLNETR